MVLLPTSYTFSISDNASTALCYYWYTHHTPAHDTLEGLLQIPHKCEKCLTEDTPLMILSCFSSMDAGRVSLQGHFVVGGQSLAAEESESSLSTLALLRCVQCPVSFSYTALLAARTFLVLLQKLSPAVLSLLRKG